MDYPIGTEANMKKFLRRRAKCFVVPELCALCFRSTHLEREMCPRCNEFIYCSSNCLEVDKIPHKAYCREYTRESTKKVSEFGLDRWNYGDIHNVFYGGNSSSSEEDAIPAPRRNSHRRTTRRPYIPPFRLGRRRVPGARAVPPARLPSPVNVPIIRLPPDFRFIPERPQNGRVIPSLEELQGAKRRLEF